jgi:hypothetical protein
MLTDAITKSYKAEADYRLMQYHAVKVGAAAGGVLLAGAGEGFGILANKPNLGEAARVCRMGLAKAYVDGTAGGGIAIGSYLKADASGHLVVTTTDNDNVVAKAEAASTALGDIIEVFVLPGLRY